MMENNTNDKNTLPKGSSFDAFKTLANATSSEQKALAGLFNLAAPPAYVGPVHPILLNNVDITYHNSNGCKKRKLLIKSTMNLNMMSYLKKISLI